MNSVFRALLDGFNAQIEAFSENDVKLYDFDNRDQYIGRIIYDEGEDKFFCEFKEDEE